MECDQVFMVLTRAPFPTGTAIDAPVETHLARCPSCGRVAEALRPAPELFHEALTPREGSVLPGYRSGIVSLQATPAGYVSMGVRYGGGAITQRRPAVGRRVLPAMAPLVTAERSPTPWRELTVLASFLVALAAGMTTLGWVLGG
jgi:hypothetical protein